VPPAKRTEQTLCLLNLISNDCCCARFHLTRGALVLYSVPLQVAAHCVQAPVALPVATRYHSLVAGLQSTLQHQLPTHIFLALSLLLTCPPQASVSAMEFFYAEVSSGVTHWAHALSSLCRRQRASRSACTTLLLLGARE
jgi:hypothetical protein